MSSTNIFESLKKDQKQAQQISSNLSKIVKDVSTRAGQKESNIKWLLSATNSGIGR